MSLTKEDKNEVNEIVVDAMTTVMMPVLDKILDKLDEHDKRFDKIEEDLTDVKLTVNRIETLQMSELNRVDNHEVRISQLEKVRN